MAGADELIREAFFEFRNVSPGATDVAKRVARAKRIANRIIRKYPKTIEAEQAREILWSLGEQKRPALIPQVHVHDELPQHRPHKRREPVAKPIAKPLAKPRRTPSQTTFDPDSWAGIWQKIAALSKPQRNVLGVILFIIAILLLTVPFLFIVFVFYALKPSRVKKHLNALLDNLD